MKALSGFVLFAVAITVLFVGCTQRIGDFTLISTKNVDIGGKYKKVDGRFEGTDAKAEILGIPLGIPDLKQAVDNCIESGKGELISNAVVEFNYWSIILYGQRKYIVKGDVWAKASMGDLNDPDTELYSLRASDSGYELVSTADPMKVVKVQTFAFR
jgi:hypothetical protein